MKKVIALIRTSTDKQEVESQKKEVVSLILADGYKEEEIEVVGGAGASAIKLDEAYLANLNKVYALIETGCFESVYAWGIDRIGRNEEVLMQFKNRLIKNRVQLVIKNPSLRLLNNDGSTNSGVELAFSLFATMAKQEMETKKERFHRGKKRNAATGKFNGGTVPYGYTLDENNFYIPHPEQSEVVKLAFELMATDKYTIAALTEELRSRGIVYNGRLITFQYVACMLKNTCYKGYRDKYAFHKVYPRLVSDEQYDKVQQVLRNNNSSKTKNPKHYNFASLLIKCPECGRNYIAHHGKYVCSANNTPSIRRAMGQLECSNNLMVHSGHLDGVLWSIALRLHYKHIQGLDVAEKTKIKQDIILIDKKIKESQKLLTELDEKLDRIEEIYIETGKKERYESGKRKIEAERVQINNTIIKHTEERNSLENLLNTKPDEMMKWIEDNFIISQMKHEENEKNMYDLVHRYISSIQLSRTEIPPVVCDEYLIKNGIPVKENYDLSGRKAVKVDIYCFDKTVVELYYIPNFRLASSKCFTVGVASGLATPFDYEPIIREGAMATTESNKRSIDFIKTVEGVIQKRDKVKFFTDELPAIISGKFDYAEGMKVVVEAYKKLYSLRDFRLMLTTFSAMSKLFGVDFEVEKLLRVIKI